MKPLLTAILIFIGLSSFAQKQNVYFLTDSDKYVSTQDSADYIRIVREPDRASTLFNVFEYYPNGKPKSLGKSSTIEPPTYEGEFATFYANGKKKRIFHFSNNRLVGPQYDYYPNGQLYHVKDYAPHILYDDADDKFTFSEEYDSLGTQRIKEGNGYHTEYDSDFKQIVDEGPVKNGKPDGNWKGFDKDVKVKFVETYHNDSLVSGISVGEHGDTVKYTVREVKPHYKTGTKGFIRYLVKNIYYPDYEKTYNIQGVVVLQFIVEKDGKVSNVKVTQHVSKNLDNEAASVIKDCKDWVPGIQYGRYVRSYFIVPINFALGN
jgi:TonB family protein